MSSHKAFIAGQHGGAAGRKRSHRAYAGGHAGLGPCSTSVTTCRRLASTKGELQRSIMTEENAIVNAPRLLPTTFREMNSSRPG
ncbi:MAG: hypothetical protein JO181_14175 [Solirubrobacterales bacterium]|nr:hypothetical protein [Solirubrobacterales bacterium]